MITLNRAIECVKTQISKYDKACFWNEKERTRITIRYRNDGLIVIRETYLYDWKELERNLTQQEQEVINK